MRSLQVKGQGADFLVKGKGNGDSLGNKKEENLPGASVHPSHASKGIQDLKFRVENDVDMVFSSARQLICPQLRRSSERSGRTPRLSAGSRSQGSSWV